MEASCTRKWSLATSSTVAFTPCRKFSSGARDSVTLPTITDMTAKVPAGVGQDGSEGDRALTYPGVLPLRGEVRRQLVLDKYLDSR